MKRLILALAAVACLNVHATPFSTDFSDLWYNAPAESESGWGMNVIQQGDILFITLFVYAPDGTPTWFVAPAAVYSGTAGGAILFSGSLYATTGSGFNAPWNPGARGTREVGSITFAGTSVISANVSYVVDGQQVQKSLVRQTWRGNSLAGSYIGATIGTYSGCPNSSLNGYSEEPATITVTHGASPTVTMTIVGATSCTFTGQYGQAGRMGAIEGTTTCTGGVTGNFSAFEVEASLQGLTGRAIVTSNACNWSGRFGGLRRD